MCSCSDARVGGMLAGKPGLLHCHMGAGGPPRSSSATGGNGASAGNGAAAARGDGGAVADRDPLAPLFDAVQHSDVPVRGNRMLLPIFTVRSAQPKMSVQL